MTYRRKKFDQLSKRQQKRRVDMMTQAEIRHIIHMRREIPRDQLHSINVEDPQSGQNHRIMSII